MIESFCFPPVLLIVLFYSLELLVWGPRAEREQYDRAVEPWANVPPNRKEV